MEKQNKTLENSAPFHLISNVKGVKLVNCNTSLMEVFSKKMLILGDNNISSEVALQII